MPNIRVDITRDRVVMQTITDEVTGTVTDVPLLPNEAFELGKALVAASRLASRTNHPTPIIMSDRRDTLTRHDTLARRH